MIISPCVHVHNRYTLCLQPHYTQCAPLLLRCIWLPFGTLSRTVISPAKKHLLFYFSLSLNSLLTSVGKKISIFILGNSTWKSGIV